MKRKIKKACTKAAHSLMLVMLGFVITFAVIDVSLEIYKYYFKPDNKIVGKRFEHLYDWPVVPEIVNPATKATKVVDPERPLVPIFLYVENRCVDAGEFRKAIVELGFRRLGAGLDNLDLQDEVNTNNLAVVEIWFNLYKQYMVAYSFVMEDSGLDYTCILGEGEDFTVDNLNAILQHPFDNEERGS